MGQVFGWFFLLAGAGLTYTGFTVESAAESAFHQIYSGVLITGGLTTGGIGALMVVFAPVAARIAARLDEITKRLPAASGAGKAEPATTITKSSGLFQEAPDGMVFCRSCSELNPKIAEVCFKCGTRLLA